jgi:PAS domain S-box-containing protein
MWKFFRRLFNHRPAAGEESVRVARAGQVQAERGLKQSEEHFGQLVAGVRDYAVFLLDRGGHIRTWNAGAERIKGYKADEIIGKHFSTFYPPDAVSSGWPAHELEVASVTGRFEDEGWRVRKDGSRFWANVVITALRDESGEVRGFLKITRDLTDRKQAEEKLRLSEERFRLIVEGVKDYAIFMLDPHGRVATWNAGAERLKGYTAAEIVGQHFSKFYPEDALARGWPDEELRRAAAEGRIEDEGWRVRKDGSRFWANVVITPLRDESGTLRGFAKVTRDLTERREAELTARLLAREEAARQAAEESAREIDRQREQLHVTLASIGDAVVVTDAAGAVTFLNPVAAELTGWKSEEAAGQPLERVFKIINEVTREDFENPVARVFRERRVVELANHTALVAKDGREVPIEDTAAPIRGRDDVISGAVLVFRDVTEARRADEARRRLAAIVESSDDAIIGQTLDGHIASWNRGAERLYGYSAAEVVGKSLAVLVPPDHPDEIPALTERLARGEHIDHFETQRVRKDGTRVDVSLTISPIRDSDGNVIGASKIARDISARKEEDRRKTEFLALLAHELRNPLAPLRSGLQVIRLAGDDRAAVEREAAKMERQLHHLVRLVDDLLDVSRISRGKLHLRKERISLAAAVGHTLEVCGRPSRRAATS